MKTVASYSSLAARVTVGDAIVPYVFCHPLIAGKPFYLGIPDSFAGDDTTVLKAVLGGRRSRFERAHDSEDEGLPSAVRLYDISDHIPPFVRNNVGRSEEMPGPNCYQAVLASMGYVKLAGRYVDPKEARYYLTRDFKEVPAKNSGIVGGMLVYYRQSFVAPMIALHAPSRGISYAAPSFPLLSPSAIPRAIGNAYIHVFYQEYFGANASHVLTHGVVPLAPGVAAVEAWEREPEPIGVIDAGVHAAVVLPGGAVFQKGCYRDDCGYRIIEGAKAMSSIETKRPGPFDPTPKPEKDDEYVSRQFARVSPSKRKKYRRNDALSARLAKWSGPVGYYADRIAGLADVGWSLRQHRIDLLTVENMWRLMSDIESIIRSDGGGLNETAALLKIDKGVAEAFLRLKSLVWQYNEMIYKFVPMPERPSQLKEALIELYVNHYIHTDSAEFKAEIAVHLGARLVAPSAWPGITQQVIAEVKTYDPVQFAESNGARGIPFFDILEKAIAAHGGAAGNPDR